MGKFVSEIIHRDLYQIFVKYANTTPFSYETLQQSGLTGETDTVNAKNPFPLRLAMSGCVRHVPRVNLNSEIDNRFSLSPASNSVRGIEDFSEAKRTSLFSRSWQIKSCAITIDKTLWDTPLAGDKTQGRTSNEPISSLKPEN